MRSVALTTVSSCDDGWIHQLCYLPIKWLFPNTTSNLANHSWLISCTVFSLSRQLCPPPPCQASHGQGAQLPERPGSQQALYSVTQMVIHINHKRHQTDPLFPVALRQTHAVLFWNEKSCLWTEKFKVLKRHSDVLKLKRRVSLCRISFSFFFFFFFFFIKVAELKLRNVSVFQHLLNQVCKMFHTVCDALMKESIMPITGGVRCRRGRGRGVNGGSRN